ncbi:hypothetical protein [Arthrobacter sp. Marseille-P9274]|uniref:hypothetical protein n=1 Tax=Arthrobacter sp. Marseille-P9274 TaxID=2866572 RepID=UPI0021C7CF4B|nr:hypothetical protein [Arthrobacter sp. Marseille-P9274]
MGDPRDKMKSMARAFLSGVAETLRDSQRREAALSDLGIDTKYDQYHDVIGKLAAEIVELKKQAGTK